MHQFLVWSDADENFLHHFIMAADETEALAEYANRFEVGVAGRAGIRCYVTLIRDPKIEKWCGTVRRSAMTCDGAVSCVGGI
jgi:hypothetical protein